MGNSRRCDICKNDFNRKSFAKNLRSKKHLDNGKQSGMILPEWLFKERFENKTKKV